VASLHRLQPAGEAGHEAYVMTVVSNVSAFLRKNVLYVERDAGYTEIVPVVTNVTSGDDPRKALYP
jgi:hypothetical protein